MQHAACEQAWRDKAQAAPAAANTCPARQPAVFTTMQPCHKLGRMSHAFIQTMKLSAVVRTLPGAWRRPAAVMGSAAVMQQATHRRCWHRTPHSHHAQSRAGGVGTSGKQQPHTPKAAAHLATMHPLTTTAAHGTRKEPPIPPRAPSKSMRC
jgi:hypothetical protein